MGINFDTSGTQGQGYDSGDTNVKVHKKHDHTIGDTKKADRGADQISQSTAAYQEDYIPAADGPDLPPSDPNASNESPTTVPRPQVTYVQTLGLKFQNLSPEQLASLGKNVTKEQAQNMLAFAFDHPGVPVDPAVQNLLNQLESEATAATRTIYKDPNFVPGPPNTKLANQQIALNNNANFETAVRADPNISNAEANALIFAHYNPEYKQDLTPDQQNLLSGFENEANTETAQENGLPENWQQPVDSSPYNAKINVYNDEAFTQHLNTDPETKNLSPEDKAQLETLHQFPDADVPDKAKLMKFLPQLNKEAAADTQKKFNLPAKFEPGTCFEDYVADVLGDYKSDFEENVKNFESSPPLTPFQKQQLLATGGLPGKNLPPNLQAAFAKIQGKTIAQIAELYGLPKNWLQVSKGVANVEVDGESEEVDEGAEEGESGNESVSGTKNKKDAQGVDAFPRVAQKHLKYHHKLETEGIDSVNEIHHNRDFKTGKNAIKFFSTGIKTALDISNKYNLLNGGWMKAGDFMYTVHIQLDKLRNSVYQMEYALANLSQKTSAMSVDNQESKNYLNHQAQIKQDQHPKICFLVKIFGNCPLLLFLIPGFGQIFLPLLIPMQVAAVVDNQNPVNTFIIKTAMWALDCMTGGAISAICQACKIESPGENPFQQLHILSKAQAAKMDMAVQIIVMVVEMVVEVLLCQPELIAADISAMTANLTVKAVTTAIKVAVKEAIKTAVDAAKDAVKSVSKLAIKVGEIGEHAGDAAKAGLKAISEISSETFSQDMKIAFKDIEKAAEDLLKNARSQIQKILREVAGKAASTASDAASAASDAASDSLEALQTQASRMFRQIAKMIDKEIEEEDDVLKCISKLAAKAARGVKELPGNAVKGIKELPDDIKSAPGRLAKMASTPAGAMKLMMMVQGLITASLNVTAGVIQGIQDIQQANLIMRKARLEADITGLNTDYQIENKVLGNMLNSMSLLAGWVNDINKMESEYWKKSQIHFIPC